MVKVVTSTATYSSSVAEMAAEHMQIVIISAIALFIGICCFGAWYLFAKPKSSRPSAAETLTEKSKPAETAGPAAADQPARPEVPTLKLAEQPDVKEIPEAPAEPKARQASRDALRRSHTMDALSAGKLARARAGSPPPAEEADRQSSADWAKGVMGNVMHSVSHAFKGDVEETRVIFYDTQSLGTWAVFTYSAGTVMQSGRLWKVMGYLAIIAILCGALVNFYPRPQEVDPTGFRKIATFLKVFVAFLIGFFMTSALTTWKNTVAGFLELCNAVRNTQMQLLVFGVEDEKIDLVVRYGALSVVFLVKELEMAHRSDKDQVNMERRMFDELVDEGHLTTDEKDRLLKVEDRAELMWVWVTSFMAKLSEDGEVPAMSSPTFGRILQQAQGGEMGIRQVHTAISIQIPFIYVHTLAALVHINNVLCAVSLGLSLGISVGTIMIRLGIHPIVHRDHVDSVSEIGPALQKVLVALLSEGVGPFMYTAFLQIALSLAYPFGEDSKVAQIPHNTFITKLMHGCENAKAMAEDPPGWDRPRFKHKHHKKHHEEHKETKAERRASHASQGSGQDKKGGPSPSPPLSPSAPAEGAAPKPATPGPA